MENKTDDKLLVVENLKKKIYTIRNQQVMLDSDLAKLYGITVSALNQAVKRNLERFPNDFMFQLTKSEQNDLIVYDNLKYQKILKSQIVISSSGWGGKRTTPFVFTEQGVAMLSGVLKSERAVQVNIYVMRAFVAMRRFMQENAGLIVRVDSLEKKQIENNKKFKVIFSAMDNKVILKKQKLFFDGQIFDAYKFVNDILKGAKKSIIIIDNYIDESVFVLFSELNINITIYTEKITEKLKLDLEKYNQQYPKIEIKILKKCHDRFLIIDNTEIYHLGASIKDLGKKMVAISKMNKESLQILNKLK
ncbi:MAG TPA: ORF6N domain-containing protein [archaeon]|nr:ORF6N domain-containing protein [archaeon]HPV66593.1 ORF6N domain-containing protein [archaeon]